MGEPSPNLTHKAYLFPTGPALVLTWNSGANTKQKNVQLIVATPGKLKLQKGIWLTATAGYGA